jgi:gamma-glutamyl-gamma-aminobutyrate hydrolase PuuD
VDIEWIEASHLEVLGNQADKADVEKHTLAWKKLKSVQGILVPGGFGNRGIEGLILTANYARVHNIPYFGICLGLQTAVIEFARNVCGLTDAHSSEFDKNSSAPVVFEMPEISQTVMGGTMRLGARRTNLKAGTLAHQLYNEQNAISERHRHRYEVNGKYISTLESAGLVFSGIDDKQERMEIVELPERSHPYYLAVQFHPEFMSRPLHPSPVFRGFIRAAAGLFVRGKNMSVCKRATSPPPSTSRGTSSGSTSDSTVEHKDDSSAPTATAIATATISTSTATPARGTTESADATSTKKHIADTPLPTPGPVFEPITQKRDW